MIRCSDDFPQLIHFHLYTPPSSSPFSHTSHSLSLSLLNFTHSHSLSLLTAMSFFQQSIVTSLSSKFDEMQWVKQIQETLDEELLEDEIQIPVTIFGVPKSLAVSDPDSYSPQQVAIGPYHHLRLELYDMERYKVAAAKRIQRELNDVKLQTLVDSLTKHELRLRACYHRPVSFGCDALAWMMAVDVCFLFEFIRIKQGKIAGQIPSGLSHLLDTSGNRTAHNCILRDILMLENQIPMFVMRMLLDLMLPTKADEALHEILAGVCRDLSPFDTVETVEVKDRAHLLDFLYHFIVPRPRFDAAHHNKDGSMAVEVTASFSNKPTVLRQILKSVRRLVFSNVVVNFPWTILGKIPIVNMFKKPVMRALSRSKEKRDLEEAAASKPPLLEEIAMPSVTHLSHAGVQFVPTHGGISTLNFDEKSLTFFFPVVNLDVNSVVVLRNLVAYEACSGCGPLILARYTELMNAIIEKEEDAKFLCERGIIVNRLKSEREVADLWNGMSKSVRLTKVPSLDKVIADVNRFYSSRWKVKMGKFMREYVFGSWKVLTFLAAIVTLLLMCLQAFCQVYSCSRVFPIKALEPTD